jgi:tetratricopeptide (TPR) repeat protein
VVNYASTARDLPPRQRTMRAALDWSRSLLTPDQQLLFRLLAVFRGGATLTAVEQVAVRSTQLPEARVLGLLEQLVEQSMVVVRPGLDGQLRYTMLEPVAQYARTLLVGEEAARAEQVHGEFYRELAERAAAGYERADQVQWVARTEADEANLLVAVERAREGGRPELAGRIVWALWLYWWLRGQPSVGWSQAERCLTVELPDGLRARVHLTAATMSYAAGDVAAASLHWDQALRLGRAVEDAEVTCKALAGTGLAALAAGALDRAASCFRGSLPVCHEAGDAGIWMRSLVHVWLGTVVLLEGDPRAAVSEIDRGLQVARSRGDRLSTYVALYNLSQAAIAAGEHDRARGYLEEGIELSEQTRDLANLAYFLDALAVVENVRAAHDRVAVLLGAAQSFRETVGANVYAYYVPDQMLREEAERAARQALGDDGYDDRGDVGRALDLTGAVRYALAATDQPAVS